MCVCVCVFAALLLLLLLPPECLFFEFTCTMHQQEYADQDRLKGLVTRYSEFIDFPIYLQVFVYC